jgi:hypothetical protein
MHALRIETIDRSAQAFCHGERKDAGRSRACAAALIGASASDLPTALSQQVITLMTHQRHILHQIGCGNQRRQIERFGGCTRPDDL